jgi:hypothetical protein
LDGIPFPGTLPQNILVNRIFPKVPLDLWAWFWAAVGYHLRDWAFLLKPEKDLPDTSVLGCPEKS